MADEPVRLLRQDALADLADVPAVGRWVRNGSIRLHVLDYGGPKTPVVMLPGITSAAISMDFIARQISDIARPVLVDNRGRGLSDNGPTYRLSDYAADTIEILKGLDRPVLLGHSLGARIAAVVARQYPLRGAVLVDPPMSGKDRGAYPTPLQDFVFQIEQAQKYQAVELVVNSLAQQFPTWSRREIELRAKWLPSCSLEAVAATHRGFETDDFLDDWSAVPRSCWLIYGGDSLMVTREAAADAARANPRAPVNAISGAGHMVFWDQEDTSIALLRRIVTSLSC